MLKQVVPIHKTPIPAYGGNQAPFSPSLRSERVSIRGEQESTPIPPLPPLAADNPLEAQLLHALWLKKPHCGFSLTRRAFSPSLRSERVSKTEEVKKDIAFNACKKIC